MDFFDRQDRARQHTTRLVVLFALGLLTMIVSIDLVLAITTGVVRRDPDTGAIDWAVAADPQILGLATLGTLAVVGGGSLFKIAQLRAGGRVVAEELGGRRLNPDSIIPVERQLLNVVEEMAIASGTPAPPVYLLDQETGINAFAAGFTPADAVIGVTRGTAEQLTRDELQGVIAHEFSHILNGDMRLNIRLIGLLHGILIVGLIGHFVLRLSASGRRVRRSRQDGGQLALLGLGVGLMVVGFFGTMFGTLIKAAVGRQREFLADASAVQFTRHPDGIAGALKKIGAWAGGSRVASPNAPEASHLFFGQAASGLNAFFATHPPLGDRIRRIDPAWDGTFPTIASPPGPAARAARQDEDSSEDGPRTRAEAGARDRRVSNLSDAVDRVGRPTDADVRYADRLVNGLPAAILDAARDGNRARALVYALLLSPQDEVRQRQLADLRAADPHVTEETLTLLPIVSRLDPHTRLPLAEIAVPALRGLRPAEAERFESHMAALVQADQTIDLFEWSLQRILRRGLERRERSGRPPVHDRTRASLQAHGALLLSMLAHAGHRNEGAARDAFEQAWPHLDLPPAPLRAAQDCTLPALDAALAALNDASPQIKRRVLQASAACIAADRQVAVTEAELLRAIAISLDCPMPPLLAA